MRQSLQLRLGQQLTMTPQLQQAIRLLQLSSLDLQVEIQTVLDSNLMLEQVEEGAADAADFDELNDTASSEQVAATKTAEDVAQRDAKTDAPEASELSDQMPSEIADDLPVDSSWEDLYDNYEGSGGAGGIQGDDDDNPLERCAAASGDLRDHLLWQLNLTPMTEADREIALALIDAVDDRGYLCQPLTDIAQGLNSELDMSEIEAVLKRIQRFDPPGIAARHPGECLALQLEQRPSDTPWRAEALVIVNQHLDLLVARDFDGLLRRLRLTREDLDGVIGLIQQLNPYPGREFGVAGTEYVVPDVFVKRLKDRWTVELNPDHAPRLRINADYARLIRRADSSHDNQCLKNHLQEARWFLKSLRNRNETLLRVAICIVEHQQTFFERGEEFMKPLVLRDIAESMGMHESTISRVTTQKYMHTPRGIFEFKYFFSSHLNTEGGGECSSIAIRAMIKKLIHGENPDKPLSDSKITQLLKAEGIVVARRTVAKYREIMAIPSSTDRRHL